ncbi:MAG TPA: hypothetical protein VGG29_14790 [Caulobacteraceae bacterium]|jgi:hypothetical protein
MPAADHDGAAPALLARPRIVSPWAAPASRATAPPLWLTRLAAAWREGMELYLRAGGYRSRWWRF